MVHKFSYKNIKIALDINSGAVHVVDHIVWDLLDYGPEFERKKIIENLGNKYNATDIDSAINEINSLMSDGLLYSTLDADKPLYQESNTIVKAICLHAAHDCNLRCSYCFASTGDFNGERLLLDYQTGKRAIDFLIKNSGNRKNLEVDFFGGEPLMNFDVIKDIVSYARKIENSHNKNIRFTMTTNGLLMTDDTIDYLNKEFSNVVISIDGRPEIHDSMRKTISGGSSFDIIVKKAKALADSRNQVNYYIRGTFTKFNKDFYNDVLYLADCGFRQISIEPVVAEDEKGYSITNDDIVDICNSYNVLLDEYIKRKKEGNPFNFFHFNIDLDQGPCVKKRCIGCGAGNEYVAITPDGDIYPCHQFVGDKEFHMGNVRNNIFNKSIQNQFFQNNLFTKESCRDCWARFYCGGGCAANGYHYGGSINKVYRLGCEMEKKRIECAIFAQVIEMMGKDDI